MLQPLNIKSSARTIVLRPRACAQPDRWVWPLPSIGAAMPGVRSVVGDDRLGLMLGYEDGDRTKSSIVPVYAVHEGTIKLATATRSGYAMSIDHHGEWSSYYGALQRMTISPASLRRPTVRVRAGQIIGYTTRAAPIRFELWRWTDDAGFVPTLAEPHLSTWLVLSERDPHPTGAQFNPIQPRADKAAA